MQEPDWRRTNGRSRHDAFPRRRLPRRRCRSRRSLRGPELVVHPTSYGTGFVRYHMLDKPDRKITRFFYINAEALEAAKASQPLPDGTVLVMQDHAVRMNGDAPVTDAAGAFIPTDEILNVFVMEKREGWGGDHPEALREGS